MVVPVSNKELIFQQKLLEKYGSLPELADLDDIVKRIQTNTATEDDYSKFIPKAETLIDKFKSDLRKIQPDEYQKQDIMLITSMIEANSAAFDNASESFSKLIPANTLRDMLALERSGQFSPPNLTGFMALSRYSENLSPQQQQSQFGLDYTGSPYIVQQGDKSIRQPFVFVVKTPTQEEIDREPNPKLKQQMQQQMDEIRKAAKLPIDPRVLVKIVEIAEDKNDTNNSTTAQIFLKKYLANDQVFPSFRDTLDVKVVTNCLETMDKNSGYYENFKKISDQLQAKGDKLRANESPYTGNTAPQYGTKLENHSPYADVVQERAMDKPLELPPGTKIYLQVPRSGSEPLSSKNPAGFEQIEISSYNGKKWKNSFSDDKIDVEIDKALKTIADEDSRKFFIKKNRPDQSSNQLDDNSPLKMTESLKEWQKKGSKRRKEEDEKNDKNLVMVATKTLNVIASNPDKVLPKKAQGVNFKPLIKDSSVGDKIASKLKNVELRAIASILNYKKRKKIAEQKKKEQQSKNADGQ
ncbi:MULTISPECIES: hypothetical protein [unclassified Microcoleus]|uniref:hypothetical protein n=1 Tax=unclassified Microcoleus TaxID=2642155 RepID=UPI002FD0E08A